MTRKTWHAVEVAFPREMSEAIEYGLMEAGALGTETVDFSGEQKVVGYFASQIDETTIRATLDEALRIYECPPDNLHLSLCEILDRDWLAEWKKGWQPVEVGRFFIAPTWSETPAVASGPDNDRVVIRINPGMAFGTGTHETTRLCLKAIDKYYRGESFLDVGTGTGILAIAAAKFQKPDPGVPSRAARPARGGEEGRASIHACDSDADAIEIAKENARLNGVGDLINFQAGTIGQQTPSADFVCANLTASVIVESLPLLIGATCGRLVLSGILDSQLDMIQSRFAELGVMKSEVNRDGEWIAIVV